MRSSILLLMRPNTLQKQIICALVSVLILCFPAFGFQETAELRTQQNSALSEDLLYHLPDSALIMLNMPQSSDDTMDKALPILRFQAKTPLTKGAVVLFGDLYVPGKMDKVLLAIAQEMTTKGFNALLVNPNTEYFDVGTTSEPAHPISQNNAGSEQQSDENNNATDESAKPSTLPSQTLVKPFVQQRAHLSYTFQQYQDFLENTLVKLNEQIIKDNGYLIVIASGQSAGAMSVLLEQQKMEQQKITVDTLVVHNSYWPEYDINNMIPTKLASVSTPVLDLFSANSNKWSLKTIQPRRMLAKQQAKALYRQRELPASLVTDLHAHTSAKEIAGWVSYLGW